MESEMNHLQKVQYYLEKFAEHEHRPDVAGEHPLGDLVQGILLLVFMAGILIDRLLFKTNAVLSHYIPLWVRIVATGVLLGFAWKYAVSGLRTVFGEIREQPFVIRENVFAETRHPVYLGAILMYLAAVALSLSLIGAALWIVIALYYHYLARYEEGLLIRKFGEDYRKYMQQVPMWLPILKVPTRGE